ncbi:MAG: hypothetical protein Q8O53_00670, partial [Candidatus Moranbacteria bacterium]|nr:hypothetical protein [Candidatus Moranbacteria bacterium]
MVGGSAEVWRSYDRHITSTWSGDKPQDRGSVSASLWAQYRHNDDWQTRGVVTLAHQNWDKLNLLRGSAELRYKETLICGPSVALALNKPAAYSGVHKSDLTTLGFSCRLELGGIIRTTVREADEAAVKYVGQVPDVATPRDVAPSD